jgi:hypothetical protein
MIHDIDAGVQHGNGYIGCLIEAGSLKLSLFSMATDISIGCLIEAGSLKLSRL